ncbi:MAG: DUF2628 domain-containing protein [Hyphomicrobiales bacterium]|nr:DUF2628 domain-containing protein [Hyphomicrobiales bacterium]
MRVYAAYQIDDNPARVTIAQSGFAWLAMLVPLLWLFYRRMWLEAGVYIALSLIFLLWMGFMGVCLQLALHVFLGFEANTFYEESLSRRGYRLEDIVLAHDRLEAERIVFNGRGRVS